jgi:hypothetical protein
VAANAVRSVLDQPFPKWRLLVTSAGENMLALPDDPRVEPLNGVDRTLASGLARAAKACGASHIVPLRADCTLTPGALLSYARAIAGIPSDASALLYADQDEHDAAGARRNPWLKPE